MKPARRVVSVGSLHTIIAPLHSIMRLPRIIIAKRRGTRPVATAMTPGAIERPPAITHGRRMTMVRRPLVTGEDSRVWSPSGSARSQARGAELRIRAPEVSNRRIPMRWAIAAGNRADQAATVVGREGAPESSMPKRVAKAAALGPKAEAMRAPKTRNPTRAAFPIAATLRRGGAPESSMPKRVEKAVALGRKAEAPRTNPTSRATVVAAMLGARRTRMSNRATVAIPAVEVANSTPPRAARVTHAISLSP